MSQIKKFLFDVDFKEEKIKEEIIPKTQPSLDPDQIPQFTKLEVNKYKEEHEKIGFEKGFDQGKKESLEHTNKHLLDITTKLSNDIKTYEEKNEERLIDITKSAVKVSFEIARKLSIAFKNDQEHLHAISFIEETFEKYREIILREKIKIHVNNEILKLVDEYIKQKASFTNPAQTFELVGDNNIAKGDCKIEWNSGGFEKKYSEIENEINEKIESYISSLVHIKKNTTQKSYKEINDKDVTTKKNETEEVNSENKNGEDEIKTVGGSKSIKYD